MLIGFTFPKRQRQTDEARAFTCDLETFAKQPENYDPLCVFGAIMVWREFSGSEIWGYWLHGNPNAVVGKSSGTGHDFCIVDGRYLVDAWASEIEGLPIPVVIDMATKGGQADVRAWFGDPAKWMRTRTKESRPVNQRFSACLAAPPLAGHAGKEGASNG